LPFCFSSGVQLGVWEEGAVLFLVFLSANDSLVRFGGQVLGFYFAGLSDPHGSCPPLMSRGRDLCKSTWMGNDGARL
jgi:hypothetical protein